MPRTDISQYLQSVKLPVMPEVAHALIRTLNDEDASVMTVRDVIAKDPGLTANLLRMANSAIFGLSRSVHTLDNAVTVIGMSQLRARALSICLAKVFVMPAPIDRLDFWRYCMVCAGYARWLAAKSGQDEQQAWLTGMMLRLGQLAMAQQNPALVEHIEQLPREPGERWSRERKLTGFDEGTITAEIAHRWDFPDAVVEALRGAAAPLDSADFSGLAGVLHLAGLLADQPDPKPEALEKLPADVVERLQLNLEKLQKCMPSAESLSDVSSLHG